MDQNRYALGRTLQFLGLIVLPLAISAEVFGQITLGQSVLLAAGGTLVFFIGYQIQNRS